MKTNIRPLEVPDLEHVTRINQQSFNGMRNRPRTAHWWFSDAFCSHRAQGYIAETDHPVGYVLYLERGGFRMPAVFELEQLAVAPEARGNGIAKELLETSLMLLKKGLHTSGRKLGTLTVSTGVDNAAQQLYQKALGVEPRAIFPLYGKDEVLLLGNYGTIEEIIFDLDGVLLNTGEANTYAYQEGFRKAGLTVPSREAIQKTIGKSIPSAMRELGCAPEHIDTVYKEHVRPSYIESPLIDLYDGTADVLQNLTNEGFCLKACSNGNGTVQNKLLERFGIRPYFKQVHTPDQSSYEKPAKEFLAECMRNPQHTIYVGDTASDQIMAQRGGVHFVYATYGYGQLDRTITLHGSHEYTLQNYARSIDAIKDLPVMVKQIHDGLKVP